MKGWNERANVTQTNFTFLIENFTSYKVIRVRLINTSNGSINGDEGVKACHFKRFQGIRILKYYNDW